MNAVSKYMSFRSSRRFLPDGNYSECGGGGGLPTKVKRSSISNGSFRRKVESMKALSLEEAQLDFQKEHKSFSRQPPVRSQTFDLDSRGFERTSGTGSQSSFVKHNKTFHKLFPDVPECEDLIHAYICAWQKEVPYHGRLYVTDTHACFYSSVLLKDTKVVIPVSCIQKVKKQNMALLVPNALSIRTSDGDKYLFVSLRNRDACFQLLCDVSSQLEVGSTNSSPVFSSADNSDKSKLVNSSHSSLEDSFDQHDAAVLPRLLLEPTPEELQKGGSWMCSAKRRARSLLNQREASTLNTLLVIYLILVMLLLLSSGYIGMRIVALEEQLTSLGALPEFSLRSG
ncbi:hypothetical protein NHX12_034016 [Muraenolepis orangiensis]|uniref:GRAM domain-containing protein n=1 Tax=Muraenolepis orangiensis TaxID=630683 RepID=A0A9Q0E2V9_9TELE|nr:hypothetical protein NHX12_034016 [Muraenolepis orangiensis]